LFGDLVDRDAILSLLAARIVYAANYYNVAALFVFISPEFGENVTGLGLLASGFLLGIGAFQVPGGILAAKLGPRNVAIYGTIIASTSALLTGLVHQLSYMVLLRFLVGLGMALVFSPGVALMTRYYKRGSEALAVGIYNSTFWAGGVLGLSGWVAIAQVTGWRASLVLGGVLGLVSAVLLILFVPRDARTTPFEIKGVDLRRVMLQRWIIVIGLGMLAINAGLAIISQFATFYLEDKLNVSAQLAGILAGLSGISAALSPPFSGRIYDRFHRFRFLFLLSSVSIAFGLGIAAYGSVPSYILAALLVGTANGLGATIGFSAARESNRVNPRYESLAVSWVNGIQFSGSFWTPVVFSTIALSFGYGLAWFSSGLFVLVFVVPLLLSKGRREA